MNRQMLFFATALTLAVLSGAAVGHVSLEGKTAYAGAPFDATFRVGHGCSGSPTVKLRIRMPDGVIAVEPQAKDGWSVFSETSAYDHPAASGGQIFSEGIESVTWTGHLSAHESGAFMLKARLSDDAVAGRKLMFPVYQQCEKGEERWTDPDDEDEHPAPFLTVMPKR
jgi:uncharacterized protein YcnI